MRVFLTFGWIILLVSLTAAAEEPPYLLPPRAEVNKLKSARLITSKGVIWFELYPEDAPWHVANFKYLADKGFYRGSRFHIHIVDYILQGGASRKGTNLSYHLPAEFTERKHEEGVLGMARIRGTSNPERNSNANQFHILLGDAPHMNGSYTIFGRVAKGYDVLHRLREGDVIEDLQVFVRRLNR